MLIAITKYCISSVILRIGMDNEQEPLIYSLGFCITQPAFNDMFDSEYDHYSDVIMAPMASQNRCLDFLLNRLFGRRSKKTSKLHITGLWEGNSPGTGEFPAQRASNAENVFILMTSSWIHR